MEGISGTVWSAAARAPTFAPHLIWGYRLLDWRFRDAFERLFMRCSVTVVRGCFLTYSRETKRPSTALRSKVISVAMAAAPFCGSLNFVDRGEPCHLTTLGTRSLQHFTPGLLEAASSMLLSRRARQFLPQRRSVCRSPRNLQIVIGSLNGIHLARPH